jgi:carbamoyltransferase
MNLLSIHDGHNCGVAIFINGNLVCALSEERITRKKNEYGFPMNAINYCLNYANLKKDQINQISISTKKLPPKYFLVKRNTNFKIEDYFKEQNEYWYKKIYLNKKIKYLEVFKDKKVKKSQLYYNFKNIKNEDDYLGMLDARKNYISNFFLLDKKNIFFYDHHECHAYYGFYGMEKKKKKICTVVLDGGGDDTNASIWMSQKNKLKEVYRTNIGNLGRMYRYVTLLLGMKPTEHEFKVMGLAGYALDNGNYYKKAIKIFKDTLFISGIKFKYKIKPKDNYFYFANKLKGERFDTISYAIQKYLEDMLVEWFSNIAKKFKVKDFAFSGGVAQNVKASKKILENKNISSLFIPPGPGDESLPIGAAYCHFAHTQKLKQKISNMKNPYIGISFNEKDLLFLKKNKKIKIKKTNNKEIASILSKGNPVARFSLDQHEFGPRALGNRSILADPRNQDIINLINKKIKVRDFWMPFAPSILEEDSGKIMKIIKNHKNFYMTISFDVKKEFISKIPAAVHPFDKTCRPQMVNKELNFKYYDLIKEFKKISGVGVLLNTSFNLHGEPIVFHPKDALSSFLRSGLEYLYIGEYLITKTSKKKYYLDI